VRSHSKKVMTAAVLALAACGSPEERAAREQQAARSGMAAAESTGRAAAALPATGLWSEAHVMDRLVRAGVAPRAREGTVPRAPWMGRDPLALRAGGGEVFVWIYPDSTARLAVTTTLDPETGAPRGSVTPFAPPLVFVTQNNLAALITGGTEQNIERIMLAFQAGLPAAQP
jgi:hypothetical protein